MKVLVTLVMAAVLLVTITIWAVLGFVLWVPMLVRATTVFSLALFPAALSHQNLAGFRDGLQDASGFYFRGFASAISVFQDVPPAGPAAFDLRRALFEGLWTVLFWVFVIYLVRPAVAVPILDLAMDSLATWRRP